MELCFPISDKKLRKFSKIKKYKETIKLLNQNNAIIYYGEKMTTIIVFLSVSTDLKLLPILFCDVFKNR